MFGVQGKLGFLQVIYFDNLLKKKTKNKKTPETYFTKITI